MPLAVSVIPTDLARSRGGGERCAFQIYENVRALLPRWRHVGVGATGDAAGAPMPTGWLNAISSRSEPNAQDALNLRKLLEHVHGADLVIAHQWHTAAMAALRLRSRKTRMIAIDHGGGSALGVQLARLPLPRPELGAIQSEFEARMTPMRARRVVNMRGGIVQELFAPPADERRDVDFVMVGRFVPHKGQREFLQALPEGASAQLIGPSGTYDEPYLRAVLSEAAERGVDVKLDSSDGELLGAYQRARYVVQVPIAPPGTAPELLGLSLLEGMACGSVPICPRKGASVEFAREGVTGMNYEPGSVPDLRRVLARALQDEAVRARLAAAALEESRRWTWRAAAETLIDEMGLRSA